MERSVCLIAPAKINLYLKVRGRRDDGYHDLATVMAPISWGDRVEVERLEASGIVDLRVEGVAVDDPDNLCCRAARFYRTRTDRHDGVRVHLSKRVPAGAGLGGGSSDAAAVITALERLCGVCLSAEDRRQSAFEVGADVPFFFAGGPAQVEGIGERVRPLPPGEPLWLVVVWPGRFLSTARVFSGLNLGLTSPGPVPRIAQFNFSGVVPHLRNDLERAAVEAEPVVGAALDALGRAGCAHRLMSGSGSAVFGVCPDEASARATARRVQALASDNSWQVHPVHTLGPGTSLGSDTGTDCWGVDKRQVTGF